MPERVIKTPLDVIRSTSIMLRNRSFKDPAHEDSLREANIQATIALLNAGEVEQVMRLRRVLNSSATIDDRQNPRVNRFPETWLRVGHIPDEANGGAHNVSRRLVGRTGKQEGDEVVVTEYFLAEGGDQDGDLFKVAEKHHGITGPEGVKKRIVSKVEAVTLLFTGYEEADKPQETPQEAVVFSSKTISQNRLVAA